MHKLLGALPATAVWSYEMDKIQRSDVRILDIGKYLVDILHIII